MKTQKRLTTSSSVGDLLNIIIERRSEQTIRRLREYNIETVGQLLGAIQPAIPKLTRKDVETRGIAISYLTAQKNRSPETAITRLQRLLNIPRQDAIRIYHLCKKIPESSQSYYFKTGWALGAVRPTMKVIRNSWKPEKNIRIAGGFYIIPDYLTAGSIYDQGERGTCVSNATCSLMNYKTNRRWSRQFHYHQCKMVDKYPSQEGTSLEAAIRVLADDNVLDSGNVEETVWPYNPHAGNTKHQGPPPERAFNSIRAFSKGQAVSIQGSDLVQKIIYLLNLKEDGKACPVIIGPPLFESWFSYNTADTGWVTMPFPGEAIVGYHALLIVGYDTERSLFLVRNSWGPQWARNNDRGYNGHAWIPFEYIRKYCDEAYTIIHFKIQHRIVPESERLYNKKVIRSFAGQAVAIGRIKSSGRQGRRNSLSIVSLLLRITAIILLWSAYKEPLNQAKVKVLHEIKEQVVRIKGSMNVADFFNNHSTKTQKP